MLITLFWLFAFTAAYSYFLYPLLLMLICRHRRSVARPVEDHAMERPTLSLIITAYNEEARIRAKLDNALALDYPSEQLEVIVASDGSTDTTDAIVAEYAVHGVRLVRAEERLGKENAQRHAIREARGEVLVFSDVATELPADALLRLAQYFTDPDIGAVSSEDRFVSQDGGIAGEGLYVRYEMWLRQLESRLAGLVGLSGSFFAARREICQEWDIHSPSDFNTALNCARAGLRAISAPDVLGYYRDLKDPAREYSRKVRTVLRGITGLCRHKDVLNPSRFGTFAWQVFSHKLMRWAVPWALLGTLLTTALLAEGSLFFGLLLWLQAIFYAAAAAAHWHPPIREHGLVRVVYFFVQVNVAIAHATLLYFRGTRMTVWQPSAR